MTTIPTSTLRRFGPRLISHARALLAVSTLAALAVSSQALAQSLGFSDPLTGPSSPNLSIPAEYSYTAQGLQRTGNTVYRSLVKTVSGTHLTAPKFTAEVAVNVALGDIAFVGLGQGTTNPNYGPNEPTNSFVFRIHNLGNYQSIDTAVAAGLSGNQFLTIGGIGNYAGGSTTVFRIVRDGDNVTLSVPNQNISRTYSLAQYGAAMGLTNANTRFFFGSGNTGTRFSNASVTLPVTVWASGLSPVTAWEPLFLAGPVVPDSNESRPVPTIGYNDPRWTNQHAAFVFPLGAHPWEGIVPYNFSANWINAWAGNGQLNRNPGLESHRHGLTSSSPGWAGYPNYGVPYQSYTKYSTTVQGEGEFVLQFLADNASWIYVDGALVGYQDYNWGVNGTGRYLITLTGAGAHDLGFVIWDGGGLAGGKFRLETRASFETNNPGVPLPPRAATVSLSNLTHTYDGTPKAASVSTAPGGLTTSVTYNGSTTLPINVGSYNVVATVTTSGYSGSATGTLTIGKASATITLANLAHTYDGTAKSATATTSPSGLGVTFNSGNSFTNAGSYTVIASITNPNYNASTTSATLNIAKANATLSVNGYTATYDAAAHGATGTATGVGGVNLSGGLSLGATFTNAPGGTANWSFTGGINYNNASGSVPIVINKANATITVNGYTGTYDAAAHGATGSATGVGGVNLTAGLSLGSSFTDAPGGTANWSFAGGINYNDASGTAAIVISKADATISVNGYSGIYDAVAHGATGSATGVGGVVLSGLNLGASFTDAPGGTADWTFTGGTNYNDASGSAAIVINKADATIAVNGYSGIYDAVAHGATGSATGVGGVVLSGLNLGASFTDVPGGSADWTFAGGTNYNDASGSVAIVIKKADATIAVSGYSGIFDAAAHGATGSATGVSGVTLAGLNLGASFTDAPGGTANWTFTGGTNYHDASGSVAIVINKATAAINVSGYTGIYDGIAHGATGSATGVGGVALPGLNLGASFTHVSGGTANWSFAGGINYHNASGSVPIVINKATATIVVTPYNVEYDGLSHSATVTSITGVNGESGATVGVVTLNSTHTSVGTYADSWSFAGANYNSLTGAITDVIKDTTAPVITSATSNAPTLWPPNHKMVAVTVSASASDLVGVTSLKIVSVTSSEPDNGLGDGDTANDIQITGALTVNLRAERSGGGNGRTYTITVEAKDAAGNASTKTVAVVVPKNQNGK